MSALPNFSFPSNQTKQYGPIGLYFARSNLHLVQLSQAGTKYELLSHVCVPYPGTRQEIMATPKAVKALIKKGRKQAKFHGRQVVSALPPEQVKIMSLAFPASNNGQESQTIARLAGDRLTGNLSDYVLDYVPIRLSIRDGERLGLVAAARKKDVFSYLDCLTQAGLRNQALEINPTSIRRLVASTSVGHENTLVVNTGDNVSYLTTISGRRLMGDQSIEFGEQHLLQEITEALNLSYEAAVNLVTRTGVLRSQSDDAETSATLADIIKPFLVKLSREISRALLFAESESQGIEKTRVYLLGSLGRWSGLGPLFSQLVDMQVDTIGPEILPFAVASDRYPNDSATELAVPVGLALRGLVGND